jgi:hypothetical protein
MQIPVTTKQFHAIIKKYFSNQVAEFRCDSGGSRDDMSPGQTAVEYCSSGHPNNVENFHNEVSEVVNEFLTFFIAEVKRFKTENEEVIAMHNEGEKNEVENILNDMEEI